MPEFTLKELALRLGGELRGDPQRLVRGINSLEQAQEWELSFYAQKKYQGYLSTTKAGAILVSEFLEGVAADQIKVKDPFQAYLDIAPLFEVPIPRCERSPLAWISPEARIGKDVCIYPFVYVGKNAVVEDECILFPGVYLGENTRVGKGSVLYPNVVLMAGSSIGQNCIVWPGVVIGADGFGFTRGPTGHKKIPQLGNVVVGDNVEIGANTCIDRATLGSTFIGNGVKMDNLIQVGHNVSIGDHTIIVAQTGISGSVKVGKGVLIGGQVGIADHLKIGDGAMIGSQSGIAKDVGPNEVVSGTPSMPHRLWLRVMTLLRSLPELFERVKRLERSIYKDEG